MSTLAKQFDTSIASSLKSEFLTWSAFKLAGPLALCILLPLKGQVGDYADSMSALMAALCAGLIAGMAFVFSMTSRDMLKRMNDRGHFSWLMRETSVAIVICFFSAFVFAVVRLQPESVWTLIIANASGISSLAFTIGAGRKYMLVLQVALKD